MKSISDHAHSPSVVPFAGLTVIHGNSTTITLSCKAGKRCPAVCSGGILTVGDISVRLTCEHARNLADRARDAVDAAVISSLPVPTGRTIQ